jgi:hypothetical protein
VDARVSVDGMIYEVDPDLAGEMVVLWRGLFDTELYVERGEHRYGPYRPTSGPISLHRYRAYKKTKTDGASSASSSWKPALPNSPEVVSPRCPVDGPRGMRCDPRPMCFGPGCVSATDQKTVAATSRVTGRTYRECPDR